MCVRLRAVCFKLATKVCAGVGINARVYVRKDEG
jgi:hypothetical protein